MARFDGKQFKFCDEELAHEDGPEDTLLQHNLRSNLMFLTANAGNHHGWSPRRANNALDGVSGNKTFSSVASTVFWTRLVWVMPGAKSTSWSILGRVNSEAPTPPGPVDVKVTIEVEGFGTQTYTLDESADFTTHTLDFIFDESPARPVLVSVRFWIKSSVIEYGLTHIGGSTRIYPGELNFSGAGFYPAQGFPGPDDDTYQEQMTTTAIVEYDHIVYRNVDSMIVYPPGVAPGTTSYKKGWLSYLQVKGIFMDELYHDGALPKAAYRAKIPTRSALAMRQALGSVNILKRPHCLSLGYRSEFRASMVETHHYHEDWIYVLSDSGFSEKKFWTETIMLKEPAPLIRLSMLYVPFYLMPSYAKADIEALNDDAAFVDWTLKCQLVSRGATDTVVIEHTEIFYEEHMPTDCSGVWPVMTQLRWREYGTDGPQHPTLKEGQLFAQDLELVRRRDFIIDARSLTLADISEPLLAKFYVQQNGVSQRAYTPPDQTHDARYLGFCIVGPTLWESHG